MKYIGTCDQVRRRPGGELFWRKMMREKIETDEEDFLNNADISSILDKDETWDEFRDSCSNITFFSSNHRKIFFFQTAGFEYIWKI